MKLIDYIILAVVVAVFVLAGYFIVQNKKRGRKCIGCPDGCCPAQGGGGCSCCQSCNENTH